MKGESDTLLKTSRATLEISLEGSPKNRTRIALGPAIPLHSRPPWTFSLAIQTIAHLCLLLIYLQHLENELNLDVHQQIHGLEK